MMPAIEMSGQRCGRLTVIEKHPSGGPERRTYWSCRCDCGDMIVVSGRHLRKGNVKSCGCLKKEAKVHGLSRRSGRHPKYFIWVAMHQRCENPKSKGYENYGGRGIKVCERWKSFENFLADIGERPWPKYSIDRFPNNDGDYEPRNFRWATYTEQANNRRIRRDLRMVFVNGVSMPLAEAAERAGLGYSIVWQRLKRGWNAARAIGMAR